MATYVRRSDTLVSCPFNPSHQVKSSRLCIHISKCRKHHPEQDVKICPYSVDHVVPTGEFIHHLFTCPKKSTIEKYLTVPTDDVSVTAQSSTESTCEVRGEPQAAEEVWDDADCYGTPEDKAVRSDMQPMFRSVQGMAPARCRAYYTSLFHADTSVGTCTQGSRTEPMLSIPRQPLGQPKVLPPMAKKATEGVDCPCPEARLSCDPPGQGEGGIAASCKPPISLSARLLALGRGRRMTSGST